MVNLEHAEVTEKGTHFKTGESLVLPVTHRRQKTQRFGARYGQDIEPVGRYVLHGHLGTPGTQDEGWGHKVTTVHDMVHFRNPLVIRHGGTGSEPGMWKRRLSDHYGGKTGKALSRAIVKDGFDAIVTVDSYTRQGKTTFNTSEIVDLTNLRRNPFKSQAQRRLFYAKARRGEISPKVVREWERATGKRKLPERANPSKKALAKYKDTHWGIEADQVMRKNDPDLPKELVEMGKLLELGVVPEGKDKEYALAFPQYEKTSLAFSQGKDERLYIVLPRQVEQRLKRDLWRATEPTLRLGEAGKLARGRQAGFRSPGIQVQVLGRANYVVYQTQKLDDVKEDGQASHYIHDFGEESGVLPYVAIAEDGTLWLAGGDYRVLRGGIAN